LRLTRNSLAWCEACASADGLGAAGAAQELRANNRIAATVNIRRFMLTPSEFADSPFDFAHGRLRRLSLRDLLLLPQINCFSGEKFRGSLDVRRGSSRLTGACMTEHRDQDRGKGAVEQDDTSHFGNNSMQGQLGHRDQDPLLKSSDTDFPEPGENPEHSGEKEEKKK
jgi:hypothetical protein